MSWQPIANSEVDANSPLSSSLMVKIKNDFDEIKNFSSAPTLLNSSHAAEPSEYVIIGSGWTTIKEFKVQAPANSSSLKIRVRAKMTGMEYRKFRALLNGQASDEYVLPSTNDWVEFTLTLANPSAGFYGLDIQGYGEDSWAFLHWVVCWAEGLA
jgi:hypothetical protein